MMVEGLAEAIEAHLALPRAAQRLPYFDAEPQWTREIQYSRAYL